jgi:hypothetical protein
METITSRQRNERLTAFAEGAKARTDGADRRAPHDVPELVEAWEQGFDRQSELIEKGEDFSPWAANAG